MNSRSLALTWRLVVLSVLLLPTDMATATELGIDGVRFTVDGTPTFLLGASYYGALGAPQESIRLDLDDLQQLGFNWIRVWVTWSAFDHDVSAVDHDGKPREPYLAHLKWLVAECDRRGIVVDATFTRGGRVADTPRLPSVREYRRAVETVTGALKSHRNWYVDLANERNIRDDRFVGFDEVVELLDAVKRIDPRRLVTASHAGDIPDDDLRRYLKTVRVDFISPHRPRNAKSPGETEDRSREYLSSMKRIGHIVPVHYQEPFRRDFSRGWNPTAEDFVADARATLQGGAAGWCFHNGDHRFQSDGKPRRSFDMRNRRLFDQLDDVERRALEGLSEWFPSRRSRK